jgi:hypothetical protein
MTTEDIIIHIFCHVDDRMKGEADIVKHPPARLYPSELVTIGILWALKGVSFRAFYRWLKRDYDALFAGWRPIRIGVTCCWLNRACSR